MAEFDPKPKLHHGSRWEDDNTVVDSDDISTRLMVDDDGLEWLQSELNGNGGPWLFPDDALAVLRPVDPVWQAAIGVVRTGEAWASKQDLESSLRHCKALDALRIAMTGGPND